MATAVGRLDEANTLTASPAWLPDAFASTVGRGSMTQNDSCAGRDTLPSRSTEDTVIVWLRLRSGVHRSTAPPSAPASTVCWTPSPKSYRYDTTCVVRGVKVNVPGTPMTGEPCQLNSSEVIFGASVTEIWSVCDPISFFPAYVGTISVLVPAL